MHCSTRLSYRSPTTEKVQADPTPEDVPVLSQSLAGVVLDLPQENAILATPVATSVDETTLSPILRIPPVEILSLIFAAGAEDDRHGFPHLLTQVSGWFRAVALNTPSLWNTIDYVGGRKNYFELASKLERSGDHPLDITVSKLADVEQARRMLDLLLPHINRWRTFCFEEWDQDTADVVMTSLTHAAPRLERLELAGYTRAPVNPFNGQTRRLRHISVKGMSLAWNSSLFSTAQSVYLSSASFHDPSVFAGWSRLQTLTIRADPLQPLSLNYDAEPVSLPHLTTLELNGVTEEDIVRILAFVEMPQLYRMLFTHIKDSHNPAPHILFPLPNMRELRLHATEMCQENLLRVLRQVRSLHKISFEDSSPIPTFIDALTPCLEQEDTWVCPFVGDFRVIAFEKDNAHRVYDDTDIANALVNMMRTRSTVRPECRDMHIQMCVFEGERNELTRHATKWDEERSYQSVRTLAF